MERDHVSVCVSYSIDAGFGRLRIDIAPDNLGTLARKHFCRGPADTPARTSNKAYLACKTSSHLRCSLGQLLGRRYDPSSRADQSEVEGKSGAKGQGGAELGRCWTRYASQS